LGSEEIPGDEGVFAAVISADAPAGQAERRVAASAKYLAVAAFAPIGGKRFCRPGGKTLAFARPPAL
jgi:hypothetical protein